MDDVMMEGTERTATTVNNLPGRQRPRQRRRTLASVVIVAFVALLVSLSFVEYQPFLSSSSSSSVASLSSIIQAGLDGNNKTSATDNNIQNQPSTIKTKTYAKHCWYSPRPQHFATSSSLSSSTFCPHGYDHNRIIYAHSSQGGLSDRLHALTDLANLAAHVCAKIQFPKPYHSLAHEHNTPNPFSAAAAASNKKKGGQPTHPKFSWNEFVVLTLNEDPSIDIFAGSMQDYNPTPPPPGGDADTNNNTGDYRVVRLKTSNIEQLSVHWNGIEKSLQRQQEEYSDNVIKGAQRSRRTENFVWKIDLNYFHFAKELRSLMEQSYWKERQNQTHSSSSSSPSRANRDGRRIVKTGNTTADTTTTTITKVTAQPQRPPPSSCHAYVTAKVPSEMRRLAKMIVQAMTQNETKTDDNSRTSATYESTNVSHSLPATTTNAAAPPVASIRVGLHVRRGDAKSVCDTSLEHMKGYLNCSLVQPLLLHYRASTNNKNDTDTGSRLQMAPSSSAAATVYLYSDERDTNYRLQLGRMIENDLSSTFPNTTIQLRFVDLDKFVFFHLRDADFPPYKRANNYFVFRLVQVVLSELALTANLARSRTAACNDCDPIVFA